MNDFINSTINTKFYNTMQDEHQIVNIIDKEVIVKDIGSIVSGDTNSCLLSFEINRFQDGVDLSDKKIRFNYRNSNGKFYDGAVNVKYNDEIIRFSWLLPYSLTEPGGNVIASIEFYGINEYDEQYSYKTKNFKLSVEKSLGVNDESDESYNNWTIKIENDVETIQNRIGEIEKDIKSLHIPTKLSEMDEDPEHRTVSDSQIDTWNKSKENMQSDWNETNTNSNAFIKNKPHIPKVTNDLTDELKQVYDDATSKRHVHMNKSVLDEITQDDIESWNNKSEFDGNYSSLQGIPEDLATEKYVDEKVKNIVNDSELAAVAKSGSYNDLKDTPDSLPASDVYQWAKQPQKPSYTADEVGALPVGAKIPSKTSDLQNDSGFLVKPSYASVGQTLCVQSINEDGSLILKTQDVTDGITPHIGTNGNWWIGDIDTGVNSHGEKGDDGVTPHIGANNNWYIGETDTGVTAQGENGYTPQKGIDYFDGEDGRDGVTPRIGENNHWWIGETDTGVSAEGKDFKYEDFTLEQLESLKVKGDTGTGISKIEKINTVNLVDTYRITFTDDTTFDYEVKNGVNGSGEEVTTDIPIKVIKVNGVEQTPVNKAVDITIPEAVTKTSQLTNDSNFVTNTELNEKGFLTEHQDLSDYALKNEIPKSASDIGAESSGTAENKVSSHNTSVDSHNDIRELIAGLTTRLNTLADSDDTTLDQMSEVVAYIKSNKALIDAITTGKVSVSDIIDNLTTNVSNKPLSAAQGVALKALIDKIIVPAKLSELEEDKTHRTVTDNEKKSWNNKYERPAGGIPASDLAKGVIPDGPASIDDASISTEKTWSSQKISDELKECVKFVKITVNLIGSEGNIPLGNTVYVYEIINNIETLSYSSICPTGSIVVRIPHGIQYRIVASADIEGFYAPTEVTGVAINDSDVTIRYTELAYPKNIKDLQTLAKMGLASDVVSIGDEFTTTYTYGGNEMEMPWIVTDIKDVEFEDGHTGQGVFLESKYSTIESLQFDAPHQEIATEETAIEGLYYIGRTDVTYTLLSLNAGDAIPYSDFTYVYHDTIRDTSCSIYKNGHNRVSTSALRQWLNSDADKGQWWKAPKTGYRPPLQLTSIKGFMAGLKQEFIDCVAKIKRTYYTNSVTDGSAIDVIYDKFFSATGTELYGSVNDNEGTYWTYYKEVIGLSSPSNNNNTGRIKYALNAKTSSQNCWAFSSSHGLSYYVWYRDTAGQLNHNGAMFSYQAVPACVIG